MNAAVATWEWLTDPGNWQGPGGIAAQAAEHLRLSLIALVAAALLAVPTGLWVGHTGRLRWLAINLSGAVRAVPSLGVLFVAVLVLAFSGAMASNAWATPATWSPTRATVRPGSMPSLAGRSTRSSATSRCPVSMARRSTGPSSPGAPVPGWSARPSELR